jgi:23S rRNA (guanosine2251-2'-O)-methyltransferase
MENERPKYRLIEGRNPAVEALKSGRQIFEVMIEEGMRSDEKINQILAYSRKNQIPLKKVPRRILERLSKTGIHQGIMLKVETLPDYSLESILKNCEAQEKQPLIVLVTEVLYQYNLGALVRTALAANVDAVVVPKKTKEPGAVASRSSMGAIEHIPVVYESTYSALRTLKDWGIRIVAADEKAKTKYYDADLRLPVALLVGGEDKGISQELISRVDQAVSIPMNPKAMSLNMSVAASVILYEIVRQNDH